MSKKMDREEIVNSQDYKATKAALKWWYSLPEEQRKATDIDAEPDIVDAYAEGVIYGWNHPHWIPVEDELPPRAENSFIFSDYVLVCDNIGYMDTACYNFEKNRWDWLNNVTHWMPIVPPRKEDKQ